MIPKEEREKLSQILPGYLEHIQTHPETLLVRFVGLHEVRLKARKVCLTAQVVVMCCPL